MLSTILPTLLALLPLTHALTIQHHRASLSHPLHPRQAALNTTSDTGVARAGGTLNPEAAAEANIRDDTAVRALTSTSIKSADGQCLFVDPFAGDFRQNLIPVVLKACDGSVEQGFDVVSGGKHNDGSTGGVLVVSSATQGCLNFDPRRAAGDQVIIFSCGGRADGEGLQTDSQLFNFVPGKASQQLSLSNVDDTTCLVPAGQKLGSGACSGGNEQLFTFG